ncbi:MAG: cytochrome o ubiquinol oxidase subunit IV [Candidatus Microsaccharimonas sp.]
MSKTHIEDHPTSTRHISYIIGFVLSVITTLFAYFAVVNQIWPTQVLIYIILGLAVVQLMVQMVFFLHIGRGNRWKSVTFVFTLLVVVIVVVGTLWIMANLDYNMMHMTPEEQQRYMDGHEGI